MRVRPPIELTVLYGYITLIYTTSRSLSPKVGVISPHQHSKEGAMAAAQMTRDERRDVILDVAKEMFFTHGFAATSMSAIAARLGGSKGTLYNYFRSKEELFAAMMERRCGELSRDLFGPEYANGEPREKLVQFCYRFLDMLLQEDALRMQRLVVSEAGRFPEIGQIFYDSGPRQVLENLAGYLGELMDAGLLRRDDPFVTAVRLKDLAVSGVYQLALWGVEYDFPAEKRQRQAEGAADVFLRAYAP